MPPAAAGCLPAILTVASFGFSPTTDSVVDLSPEDSESQSLSCGWCEVERLVLLAAAHIVQCKRGY